MIPPFSAVRWRGGSVPDSRTASRVPARTALWRTLPQHRDGAAAAATPPRRRRSLIMCGLTRCCCFSSRLRSASLNSPLACAVRRLKSYFTTGMSSRSGSTRKPCLIMIAQRQLVDAIAEQRFFVAAHHAVVVEMINPPFAEAEGVGGQPQQPQLRIALAQMAKNLLILTVVVIADAVALVDDHQRKGAVELREVARYRLYAA
ncbi:hypothetical protein EIO60_02835|nr:hypothetical protein [Candidatus Pantoea persica]